MIRVELGHEIVALVAVMVVEEGKIAFLAASAPRPSGTVIICLAFARRDEDAVLPAPVQSFRRGIFIGKPRVVTDILRENSLNGG